MTKRITPENYKNSLKENRPTKELTLVFVLVGDDFASQVYVRNKIKACSEHGILSRVINLGANVSQRFIEDTIRECNGDSSVTGIIVQMPLPAHLDPSKIIDLIDDNKDVDGFKPSNLGHLFTSGMVGNHHVPATPLGIVNLLTSNNIDISGKDVTVIGRSATVGLPLAVLLIKLGATVTVCHSKTNNIVNKCRDADIIVSAVGCKDFITTEFINLDKEVVLVDVGINRNMDGKVCGDADPTIYNLPNLRYTPVPGGVGPMTVLSLISNTINSAV